MRILLSGQTLYAGLVPGKPFRWKHYVGLHAEWWAIGLTASTWIYLCYMSSGANSGHAIHGMAGHSLSASVRAAFTHWQLMVVAVMFPLIVPSMRFVANRSLWSRRDRALLLFILGYLSLWAVPGVLVSYFLSTAPVLFMDWRRELLFITFMVAAVWQHSRYKYRALVGCHMTMPIAPRGLRADTDCFCYGWRIGATCLVSCWALMLACTVAEHSLTALGLCLVTGLVERYGWAIDPKSISPYLFVAGLFFTFTN